MPKNTDNVHEEDYTVVPVIPQEGPFLHPAHMPFCGEPGCPCHEDQDNIGTVAGQVYDGLLTPKEATDIVHGKTINNWG